MHHLHWAGYETFIGWQIFWWSQVSFPVVTSQFVGGHKLVFWWSQVSLLEEPPLHRMPIRCPILFSIKYPLSFLNSSLFFQKTSSTKLTKLSLDTTRNFLMSFMWVLKNLGQEQLKQWIVKKSARRYVQNDFFNYRKIKHSPLDYESDIRAYRITFFLQI